MNRKKNIKLIIFALIAVLTLGIGYAAISNITLTINGSGGVNVDSNNFLVKFMNESPNLPIIDGSPTNTVTVTDNTHASFDISTLSTAGDSVTATLTVKNISNGIGAEISLALTNSNPTYFKVTEHLTDNKLQAGDSATVTVTVEMLKTVITTDATTTITASLIAKPIDNSSATSGSPATEHIPYVYTVNDSTSQTQIGYALPEGADTYNSFSDAETEFGEPLSLAHVLNNNGTIAKSYIAFKPTSNGSVYYLRGGVDESSSSSKPVYDANVQTLKTRYGVSWANYCQAQDDGENNEISFSCDEDLIVVYTTGNIVYYQDEYTSCRISNGYSYCEIDD